MMAPTSTDSSMQKGVFASLTDPAKHPNAYRIDTHAASVFLEGDRALKIKRAVRFPYLDYSTLAKRKAACDEEMKINRKFAPQIYRRVVPMTQGNDGSLAASHAVASLVPAEPWIESIPALIEGNTEAFRTAACFPKADVDDLGEASVPHSPGSAGCWEQRGRQGCVRRCHGDLHLANMS